MADDPYEVLGVAPDADLAHIRRAYLARLRVSHPDVRPGDAEAEQRTRELNHAWEQVRNGRRNGAAGNGVAGAAPPRRRPPTTAYSHARRDFRAAFTTATLRVALLMLAVGLLLLIVLTR
jgi:curved DNA-binding protein CbpA